MKWSESIHYDYSDFDKILHVSFAYACENSVRTARERETIRDWFNNAWFCIPKSSFQIPAYENPKPNRAYKTCLNLRPIRQRPISRWHHGVFCLPIYSTIIAFQTRTVSPARSFFFFVFVITHVPVLIDLWIYQDAAALALQSSSTKYLSSTYFARHDVLMRYRRKHARWERIKKEKPAHIRFSVTTTDSLVLLIYCS